MIAMLIIAIVLVTALFVSGLWFHEKSDSVAALATFAALMIYLIVVLALCIPRVS